VIAAGRNERSLAETTDPRMGGGVLSGLGGEERGSLSGSDVLEVFESGALERVGERRGKR
jgi:hypothetical protein